MTTNISFSPLDLKHITHSSKPTTSQVKSEEDVKKATQELCKMMFRNVLEEMFPEDQDESFFGEGHSGSMWKFMFLNTLTDVAAGHTGLERSLEPALKRTLMSHKNPYQAPAFSKGETCHETV